eukprot:366417-Chlamydomonas_euryale.AAC.30
MIVHDIATFTARQQGTGPATFLITKAGRVLFHVHAPKACSTIPPCGRVKHVEACGLSEMVTSESEEHAELGTKLSVNWRR